MADPIPTNAPAVCPVPRCHGTDRYCAWADTSEFATGDVVATLANVRPAKYANRTGAVVTVNSSDGEIGVTWNPRRQRPTAWFRPDELTAVVKGAEQRHTPAVAAQPAGTPDWAPEHLVAS